MDEKDEPTGCWLKGYFPLWAILEIATSPYVQSQA